MDHALVLAVALGVSASGLISSCGPTNCYPSDVLTGRYRIEEAFGVGAPISLEGSILRVDRDAERVVLEYPNPDEGAVTFRITAWPPPQGDAGSGGAR